MSNFPRGGSSSPLRVVSGASFYGTWLEERQKDRLAATMPAPSTGPQYKGYQVAGQGKSLEEYEQVEREKGAAKRDAELSEGLRAPAKYACRWFRGRPMWLQLAAALFVVDRLMDGE